MSNFNFIGNFLGKKAKLTKDGHDISNREAFSIPFGVHVPVKHYFCVPNEHYKGNVRGVVQTAPMREDNFQQLDLHQKAVFVPMSSLCRDYINLTQANKEVRKDSLLNYPLYDLRFDLGNVLIFLFPYYVLSEWITELASEYDLAELKFSFDGLVDRTFIYKNETIEFELPKMSKAFQFLFHLVTYIDGYFALDNVESKTFDATFFSNQIDKFSSNAGTSFVFDALRLLDNLEYGNFLPWMDTVLNRLFHDWDLSSGDNGESWFVASPEDDGRLVFNSYANLYELIASNGLEMPTSESLWPLLAYQYYIHSYERSNYKLAPKFILTADSMFSFYYNQNSLFDVHVTGNNMYFFERGFLEYVSSGVLGNFAEEIRQSVTSEEEMGDDSFLYFFGYIFGLSNPLLDQDIYTTSQTSVVEGLVPSTTTTEITSNLVQTIAEKSALYKLRQDLLRGGVRRDKIMSSIFGVNGDSHVFEPCKILADSSSPIQIQGLLNQAETEVAPLGARAARGNGGVGCKFDYTTEDYGFLFIIQYVTAPSFYENFGTRLTHQLGIESWWLPQFNHLGLSPLYSTELSLYSGSRSEDTQVLDIASVLGYSARNHELKQQVNLLHGGFTNFGFSLTTFNSVGSDNTYINETAITEGNAPYGGFVSSLIHSQVNLFSFVADLYYKPQMVNNIFVNMVGHGLFNDYSTDQFRCYNVYDVRKVSPMPKIGLLKLDV